MPERGVGGKSIRGAAFYGDAVGAGTPGSVTVRSGSTGHFYGGSVGSLTDLAGLQSYRWRGGELGPWSPPLEHCRAGARLHGLG